MNAGVKKAPGILNAIQMRGYRIFLRVVNTFFVAYGKIPATNAHNS